MADKLNDAITQYRGAQAELATRLQEGDPPYSLLLELDHRLKDAFDSVMELDADANEIRLIRIGFLLNCIVAKSNGDQLVTQICDRIHADAESMHPNSEHAKH